MAPSGVYGTTHTGFLKNIHWFITLLQKNWTHLQVIKLPHPSEELFIGYHTTPLYTGYITLPPYGSHSYILVTTLPPYWKRVVTVIYWLPHYPLIGKGKSHLYIGYHTTPLLEKGSHIYILVITLPPYWKRVVTFIHWLSHYPLIEKG